MNRSISTPEVILEQTHLEFAKINYHRSTGININNLWFNHNQKIFEFVFPNEVKNIQDVKLIFIDNTSNHTLAELSDNIKLVKDSSTHYSLWLKDDEPIIFDENFAFIEREIILKCELKFSDTKIVFDLPTDFIKSIHDNFKTIQSEFLKQCLNGAFEQKIMLFIDSKMQKNNFNFINDFYTNAENAASVELEGCELDAALICEKLFYNSLQIVNIISTSSFDEYSKLLQEHEQGNNVHENFDKFLLSLKDTIKSHCLKELLTFSTLVMQVYPIICGIIPQNESIFESLDDIFKTELNEAKITKNLKMKKDGEFTNVNLDMFIEEGFCDSEGKMPSNAEIHLFNTTDNSDFIFYNNQDTKWKFDIGKLNSSTISIKCENYIGSSEKPWKINDIYEMYIKPNGSVDKYIFYANFWSFPLFHLLF